MTADVADIRAARVANWVRICGECSSPYARDALRCYDEAFAAGLRDELKAALDATYGDWWLL